MSFTKVTAAGIGTTGTITYTNVDVAGVITATSATFTGNVSVGGTLTYEDVTNVDSVGLITARSGVSITGGGLVVTGVTTVSVGSTSAPSISPTGDTNTGIFFPSADTIAFGEGGAEVARFDSSSRLLVGTSSVSHNSRAVIAGRSDGNNAGTLVLESTSSSPANGDTLGNLRYGTSGNTASLAAAAIGAERDGGTWTNNSSMPGRLVFSTTADGGSAPTERLRLTSTGALNFVGAGTAGSTQAVSFNGSAPVNSLVIDSSGRLGIGVSSPQHLLDCASIGRFSGSTNSAASGSGIEIGFNTGTSVGFIQSYNRGTSSWLDTTVDGANVRFNTSGTERMRLTSTGLGIGTTSVNAPLHVSNGGAAGLEFYPTTFEIQAYNRSTSAYGLARYNAAGHQFAVSASEAARIDSSGRLLVGTSSTSRSASLQIVQANQAVGSGQSNVGIFTSDTQALDIGGMLALGGQSGETNWLYGSVSGRSENNSYGGYLQFGTSTAAGVHIERMRIGSDGRIYSLPTYNNTAAASANMHVDSNGIFYRATSSAKYKTDIETLEDQYADALLNVRPVWYRSTTGNEPTDWSWYGFIAEEVAEIDPRLVHWKTVEGVPNENGQIEYTELETPVAEGVQYDRFVPHLLNLIKRQQQAIETLEAKVAVLESA